MKCPVCTTTDLLMTDRQGIEIDYCPQCRGVWLDRGELDKIIERSPQAAMPASQVHAAPSPGYAPPPPPQQQYRGHGHEVHQQGYEQGRHHKKKSFLTDLFDFD